MALSHAILATLLSGPVSGYKLTKRFNAAIGYFWQATHQQIYRELTSREEHGYVERVPSSSPSTEKRYALTPQGRSVLTEWIAYSPSGLCSPLNRGCFVKICFSRYEQGLSCHPKSF